MQPNKSNFCGGNFQDWLEVNLIEACNGKCAWCIERNGYHPAEHAEWSVIAEQALRSGKTNIILLGGEPTLYRDLSKIISALSSKARKVWVTTNGGLLTPDYVTKQLLGITGINISIHSSDLEKNRAITGVSVKDLGRTIVALHEIHASVRLNCNCIKGHIDSAKAVEEYISFAKSVAADKIRFAELKQDDANFVDLAEILDYQFGLNDDPFIFGCNSDAVIDGVPVNFRQMCGLQTPKRPQPKDPEQCVKEVLYYDGNIYNGWQTASRGEETVSMMDKDKLARLLDSVAKGKISPEEAKKRILKAAERDTATKIALVPSSGSGTGCQY